MTTCPWCGKAFARKAMGRPATYCSASCRKDAWNYGVNLPEWQAREAELQKSMDYDRRHGRPPSAELNYELTMLRDSIGRGQLGGTDDRDNLRGLRRACHQAKSVREAFGA